MSVLENVEPQLVWKHFDEIRKIPHCSKHEEQIRKYIVAFAKDQQLNYTVDKPGNVLISKPATSKKLKDKPIIILQGHMDMVCEKNSDVDHDFSKDPLKLIRNGDILTADGTTLGADNGIGVATSLAILEDTTIKHGPLECLFTVDEETGLTGAFAMDNDMLQGRIMLNLDSEDWGVLTVGCAGGGDTKINLPLKTKTIPAGATTYKLTVAGLRGGHSGVDIHEQRGNAVKLLGRILWKLNQHTLYLTSINGGDKHNAIPREAYALVSVPSKEAEKVQEIIKQEEQAIAREIKPIDPNVTVKIEEQSQQKQCLDTSSQWNLLNLIHGLPHGIVKMSYDIPGLVQTSTNLAKVTVSDKEALLQLSSRSSIMSELQTLRDHIRSIAELTDASVSEDDPYPGWQPNLESKLLQTSKDIYREMYGEEPKVEAIHAGLECGIIGEKFPGMDMISIGPTIKYPHSPDEQVHIKTVEHFYNYVTQILAKV